MTKEIIFEKNETAKKDSGKIINLILLVTAVCYHIAFLPGTLPLNGLTYLINFICMVITFYNIITRI